MSLFHLEYFSLLTNMETTKPNPLSVSNKTNESVINQIKLQLQVKSILILILVLSIVSQFMPSSYKLHLNVLLHIMWDLLTAMYCNVTISVGAHLLWIRSWRVKKKRGQCQQQYQHEKAVRWLEWEADRKAIPGKLF